LRTIGAGDVGHERGSKQGEHWPNRGMPNIWKTTKFSHRLTLHWPGAPERWFAKSWPRRDVHWWMARPLSSVGGARQ